MSAKPKQRKEDADDPIVKISEPIIILNLSRAQKVVPYGKVGNDKADEKTGRREPITVNQHRIFPGFNAPCDPSVWTQVAENPQVGQWFDSGAGKRIGSVEEIDELAVDDILKKSSSRGGIAYWLENETRSRVATKLREKQADMDRRRSSRDTE